MGDEQVRRVRAPYRRASDTSRRPGYHGRREGGEPRLTTGASAGPVAHFESFADGAGWNASFREPIEQHSVHALDEVTSLVRSAEAATARGFWVALALSYEAAPAFDSALTAKAASKFPLAWMGVFEKPSPPPADSAAEFRFLNPEWLSEITGEEYRRAIRSIRDYIESGDTYQINFTFPLRDTLAGDSFGCFRGVAESQGAAYSAYLDIGTHRILSFSPELFLERRGSTLITRPMKGTLARGRWNEEDAERVEQLRSSPKDRAENVMIVDLLRSDLGKVAETGSVKVTELFAVEKLSRVLQMTSTVTAVQRPDVTMVDILRAVFPSGSVTGAPKPRSMAIISELEREPRGIYTGAIGLMSPNGDAVFSVPIRTLSVDATSGDATFGVGGAITWDSTTEGEYEECRLKAKFLTDPWEKFDLLETIALRDGEFSLLDRHLDRARDSARYFGFRWSDRDVSRVLEDVCDGHRSGNWRVRLISGRNGQARAEARALGETSAAPRSVRFASRAIDDRDPLVYHKTTARSRYDLELERCAPCDDVIFWNERGEITESTIANVVVFSDGKYWTPPREAGLLAGTCRDELILRGELFERTITKEELTKAGSFFLINSVRGWMNAVLVLGESLVGITEQPALANLR
jgi:para-aminobenzoate synthetase/4-amino-4-deoxychorismate lyase